MRGIETLILGAKLTCGSLGKPERLRAEPYLSELRRDFLASVGITYAVFRIAKSRLRAFGEFC
jgi:hypothetical protein